MPVYRMHHSDRFAAQTKAITVPGDSGFLNQVAEYAIALVTFQQPVTGLLSKYAEIPNRTAIRGQHPQSLPGLEGIQRTFGHQQWHRTGMAGRVNFCFVGH